MVARTMLLLCVAGLAVAAEAQTTDSPGGTYVGIVSGTNVYVRSGPGKPAYYPCTKLSYPAKVTVVGEKAGWLKILPPAKCFSVISTEYVKPEATGKFGVVTGNRVHVRAGGDLIKSNFWVIHHALNRGDRVQIIDKVSDKYGQWYKIASPKGVYYYISPEFVRRATPATQPATVPTTLTAPPATLSPLSRESEAELAAALKAFRAVEENLKAEYTKPPEQRDLKGLLAKYRAIKMTDNSVLKPYVDSRVKFLLAAIEQMKEIQTIESLVDDTTHRQRRYETQRSEAAVEMPVLPEASYAAKGVLSASEIFTGGPSAPKRFILRDIDTRKINAYAQCTTGKLNLGTYAGKHVGILGKATYDRNLALDVVEVVRVIVLDESATLPPPPRPTVKPLPPRPAPKSTLKPTPKPTPRPIFKLPLKPTPKPTPKPIPKLVPETKPVPTTKLAPATKPLPATGLPMVDPTDKPTPEPVDETEYD